jgi:uncharacterized protein
VRDRRDMKNEFDDLYTPLLSDAEVDEFRNLLQQRCVPNGGLDLAEFDGLIAACNSAPGYASSEDYFPLIYGIDEREARRHLFASATDAKRFEDLLWGRIKGIDQAFGGQGFQAFFARTLELFPGSENSQKMGYADGWCIGYLRGVVLRQREWKLLLGGCGEEHLVHTQIVLDVVSFLHSYVTHCQSDREVSGRFRDDPKRAEIVASLPVAAPDLYRSWAAYEHAHSPVLRIAEPLRVALKPGRNEPCSCGSGKKYKKCCGNA